MVLLQFIYLFKKKTYLRFNPPGEYFKVHLGKP